MPVSIIVEDDNYKGGQRKGYSDAYRGRNEIARLINGQGLHISEGSVGNIIRAYRKCEDGISGVQSLQYGVVPNPEVVTSLASTGIDMNNTDGSPSSTARRILRGRERHRYQLCTPLHLEMDHHSYAF